MYGKGVQAYRQTNVLTADPKRLILMCYEGAIDNLRIGKEKFLAREYEAKAKAMEKAQQIINELLCALDFEKGGEIATNLDALYNYMLRRILEGDLKRNMTAIDEVTHMLEELKEAWQEISYGNRKKGETVLRHLPNRVEDGQVPVEGGSWVEP